MFKEFKKYKKIHCIGIGGTGVSGLARILNQTKHTVTGSDEKPSQTTANLIAEGIKITIGHKKENLEPHTNLVIYSPAIPENNPERLEAAKKNITQLAYPQAVGLLSKDLKTISISGTHGKTTTTAMAAAAFIAAKKDPTVIVGSSIKELSYTNERLGKSDFFILESCEYKRGFLNYHPQIIIITNIEADHLDYYKDINDYTSAFKEFIYKLPKDGLLIANYDDANVKKICKEIEKAKKIKVVTFGKTRTADYKLEKKSVYKNGKILAKLNLQIPGEHNLMNATAVISLCSELKLNIKESVKAINKYSGAKRRFEIKGEHGRTTIIDDYAHHPTEIRATLKSVREKFGNKSKILCIFEPHQYSRTRELLDEFATAFGDVDELIIPGILRVRDTDKDVSSISPQILVNKISENHPNAKYIQGFEKTVKNIKPRMKDFDVIITLGAGNVWLIADQLIK